MAIATYSTDLSDLIDFETAATLNTEVVGYTATAKPTTSSDFPIQGTGHADAEQRATGNGSLVADYGAGVTWTSGDYIFGWGVFLAAGAVNTFANAGIAFYIGADISNGYKWTVGGSDFGRYPYGGWQNFVVDPELTTGRTNVGGGAGTTYRWFGILCNVVNAISKGSPYGIDVIRYGRGEVAIINGDATAYGTFEDMATTNDSTTNRWGLFTYQGGSYIWKGLLTLGNATLVDFRDSNRTIVIENSINVNSDFNRIEINNASSNVEWTNIGISNLGTIAKGEFEMIDNATVAMDTCVFTDMSTFVFLSNATVANTTFRRTGQVTQGSATFDTCSFDNLTSAVSLVVDDLSVVTDCTFASDGSNHAVNLGTIASTTSMDWENYLSGYAGSDGSTGNEAILVSVDSGQTLTINVVAGYTTPYVYNTGAGTVTVVSGLVTIKFTVKNTEGTLLENARVFIEAQTGGTLPSDASVTITSSGTTASVSHTAHGLSAGDKVTIRGSDDQIYNGTYAISNVTTDAYDYTMSTTPAVSPATGTITATTFIMGGLTNALGVFEITDFAYGADQPIRGYVRKST